MAKRIYGPDTSAYVGAGTGQGPALVKPSAQGQFGPTDPRAFVHTRLVALGDHYESQYKATRDPQEAARIQQEYDTEKFRLADSLAQIDYIQALIDSGYDPEAGLRAQREVAGIRLPAPEQPRTLTPSAVGLSPSGMKSYVERFNTVRESILEYAKGKKWYRWDVKTANRDKMIERYFNERNLANLNDPRNAAKVPGFNQAFIESMGQDERTAELIKELLDPVTGDPRMLAAFSPDSPVNRAFLSQFGVTKKRPGISPVSQGIANQLPKAQQPVEDFTTMSDEELIRIAGGM